jgi:ABC-type antimicrobial peptide transport system permease subunit
VFTSLADQRYRAVLLSVLASVAAILAANGVYGAIARGVTDRRREIGVRLALGARPQQVSRMFLAEAARLAAVGGLLGLIGACGAARISAALLFGGRDARRLDAGDTARRRGGDWVSWRPPACPSSQCRQPLKSSGTKGKSHLNRGSPV